MHHYHIWYICTCCNRIPTHRLWCRVYQHPQSANPHTFRKVSEETENVLDGREPTLLDYVEESQENPQDPPDPNPEDGGDGDKHDDPGDESPKDNEPGERFLQVMSDLAAGIRTLHQSRT